MTTPATKLASLLSAWRDEVDAAVAALPVLGAVFTRRWRILRVEPGGLRYLDAKGGEIEIPDDLPEDEARARVGALSRSGPLALRFSPALGFRRMAKFPAAASAHLDEAARLALPRLSPLPPADAACAVERPRATPAGEGWIEVPLAIVRKDALTAALRRAAALGLTPTAADFEDSDPLAAPVCDLREGRRTPGSGRSAFRWGAALTGVALLFAAAAWGDAVLRLQPRLDILERAPGGGPALEAAIAQARLRTSSGSATIVLADLSRRLPDGAYLTALDYQDGVLRVTGLAWDAAAALRALDGAVEFDSAAFAGATVRDEASGRERFEIVLSHRPAAGGGS
ncbi:MAG: PilN domain-containing protein [Maricaulaceae bacterium]|nr:PilN domain-containing protein [Maricaulaceae bacterium]